VRIGVTTFGCDAGRSGIGRYARELLREFASDPGGDEVEVLVHRDERHALADFEGLRVVETPGLMQHPVADIAWHQAALPAWAAWRRWDVLFLPSANRRLPLACPCPAVGTVHDLAQFHVDEKYDAARMFYVKRVLPAMVRRLDHVLTVSGSSRDDIVRFLHVPPERVTVTPLGVDHGRFRPLPAREAARIAARHGVAGPYILYVSRIEHPGKNHVGLIRAFSIVKRRSRIPHVLALVGPEWTRADEVRAEAARSPCASDIRFLSAVPGDDLPGLYAGADLFVMPSLFEGFGLPVLESMACGVPVACSNVSSMPEVAGDAGVPFDPRDDASIADAMERVLSDRKLRADLARRSIERAAGFTWERTARMTLDVLRQAARGP
jgi:glycosyltransferase involved in cell wall biosynthesis